MTHEQLRGAVTANPFKPFRVCLADGREIAVKHPELILVPPEPARTFVVYTEDGLFKLIDLLLVVSLDYDRNGRTRRRRRRQ